MSSIQIWTLILIGLSWAIWAITFFWIYHKQGKTIQTLLDRLMARDYGQFVQGQIAQKEAELTPSEKEQIEPGIEPV